MKVNEDILRALDEYHERSLMMQEYLYEGNQAGFSREEWEHQVNDPLIFHVPIYDMLDRRYAAFSSFPEALHRREKDPKGYGIAFKDHGVTDPFDRMMLLYLFRLCGSGINYVPGSHGFGNFWIVQSIKKGYYTYDEWLKDMPQVGFSDCRGYMLPMISGGLRNFIQDYAVSFVSDIENQLLYAKHTIMEIVDYANDWLIERGFKRQTFVLSAFAADLAEYFPAMVYRDSMIYAGTNAKKCIKAIFQNTTDNDAIQFLSERYGAPPYSVEDSRLCDPVRYFCDYQSTAHIKHNNNIRYANNSILKKIWSESDYRNFVSQLLK